jgi:hypothetical protein
MASTEQRIRARAYEIWEEEGRPEGREREHWERARFLVGLEDNADAGLEPNPMVEDREKGWNTPPPPEPVEPIEALENQGEFPDRFADQGEKSSGPVRKKAKAAATKSKAEAKKSKAKTKPKPKNR